MFRNVGKRCARGCITSDERIPESLHEWVATHIQRASNSTSRFSLVIIDLDEFAKFNANHGFAMGDRVLHRIESKFERWLRSSDDVARCGNDEFALVLWGASKEDSLGASRRIQSQILRIEGVEASIGCATFGQPTTSADLLVVEAKMGMWRSRAQGGNLITHYEDLEDEHKVK